MTTRQVLLSSLVLGVVAAAVVWWLERYNRDLLIAQFREQLERLPTYQQPNDV
jgi:hypothetical protein